MSPTVRSDFSRCRRVSRRIWLLVNPTSSIPGPRVWWDASRRPVHAVSHRRVTNKHYDAFASAVSINQTAPVAVPRAHYRAAPPYVMPFRLRSPSVLTTRAEWRSPRIPSKLFSAAARESRRCRPVETLADWTVWTRCRQIERALAMHVALWFIAVTSTSRFIRRSVNDVRAISDGPDPTLGSAACSLSQDTAPPAKYFKSLWCNINEARAKTA